MEPLKYKINPKFKTLFANLVTGKEFTTQEAFSDPNMSVRSRKSVLTDDEARIVRENQEQLEKLLSAGFVIKVTQNRR